MGVPETGANPNPNLVFLFAHPLFFSHPPFSSSLHRSDAFPRPHSNPALSPHRRSGIQHICTQLFSRVDEQRPADRHLVSSRHRPSQRHNRLGEPGSIPIRLSWLLAGPRRSRPWRNRHGTSKPAQRRLAHRRSFPRQLCPRHLQSRFHPRPISGIQHQQDHRHRHFIYSSRHSWSDDHRRSPVGYDDRRFIRNGYRHQFCSCLGHIWRAVERPRRRALFRLGLNPDFPIPGPT